MPTFDELGIPIEPKDYTMGDFILNDECPPKSAIPVSEELKQYLLEKCFPYAYVVDFEASAKIMRTAHCKYIRLVYDGAVYLAFTNNALVEDVATICYMDSPLEIAGHLDELKMIPIGINRLTHMKANDYNILMNLD